MAIDASQPRYRVAAAHNPLGLPVGTLLLEIRRYEGWDHHGCIPSVRTLVAELRVLAGPRAGETTEAVIEQGYGAGPTWSGLEAWLEEVGAPRPTGLRPSLPGPCVRAAPSAR